LKTRSDKFSVVFVNRTRQRLPLAFLQRAATATLTTLHITSGSVTVAFVGARRARTLNREFRKKDRATNVLSFSYERSRASLTGDVVVCVPVAAREAKNYGRSVQNHLAMLVVHGIVHLAGHDHETQADAKRMERLEAEIARKLRISDQG
jgi:probable rRNA maturation factor